MEKNVCFSFNKSIDKDKIQSLSPVVLAFIGDAFYSLYIREKLALSNDSKTGELNKMATNYVKASSQAEFIQLLLPYLTEEEIAIYKRGRNTKKATKSKSASITEYNMSTGFEALIGYLYLNGDYDRINFLLDKGNR